MKIAVGLSGGVDSSVAAHLLLQAGHEVIGTIMKIWDGGCTPAEPKGNACYGPDEEEDIADAQKVSDYLGIPLHVIDCAKQYKEIVLANFKSEYHVGRTPNPCVLCNQNIKFGVLPSLLTQSGISFDRFATGHYARIAYDTVSQRYHLTKALDNKKDQTYFLYRLTQEQLAKALFPLGEYDKSTVRKMASEAGLPVHDKSESQDFYSGDYTELLETTGRDGNIVNTEGTILGKHSGIWHYTIGQRKGLGISHPVPLYVLEINAKKNEIVVGEKEACFSKGLSADHCIMIAAKFPEKGTARIRSNSKEVPCSFTYSDDELQVLFDEAQSAVTPGQSVVLYDEEVVLGGGIIKEALS